ncbi:hypothetical protein RV18_GL000699 [Enterococcus termitis]|nr:hypothetical protein RV18_GL000699 [Enterococcus termitis]
MKLLPKKIRKKDKRGRKMEVYLLVYKNEVMAAYVDFEFAIDRKDDLV